MSSSSSMKIFSSASLLDLFVKILNSVTFNRLMLRSSSIFFRRKIWVQLLHKKSSLASLCLHFSSNNNFSLTNESLICRKIGLLVTV